MIVGVVGPMLAPFLLSIRNSKEEFVATKSFCQGSVQAIKVIMFLTVLKFDYMLHSQKIIVLGHSILRDVLIELDNRTCKGSFILSHF